MGVRLFFLFPPYLLKMLFEPVECSELCERVLQQAGYFNTFEMFVFDRNITKFNLILNLSSKNSLSVLNYRHYFCNQTG